MKTLHRQRIARCLTFSLFLFSPILHSASLNISQVPLAKSSSATVKPNVMFILDDSGSMAWDYLPDYVRDDASDNSRPPMCFDAGDDSGGDGDIGGGWDYCKLGDPPYMSPDFNASYYNPEVVYQAGVNADGSSMGDQTNLASVKTDPYGQQQRDQLGNAATSKNLGTEYPERVYCDSQSADASDTARCKSNSGGYAGFGTDYRYPGPDFPYGTDAGGNRKYRFGAPYYTASCLPISARKSPSSRRK
jgi:type IV pilus assembly protein PilY1